MMPDWLTFFLEPWFCWILPIFFNSTMMNAV